MTTRAKHPFDDFRNFAYHVWKLLNLPAPTPVQYDIARYLHTGPRRCIIMAYRGVGKSWLTAAYACWLLWKDPQHKIMVVSASKERADAFSVFVKRLIDSIPELYHLRPRSDQRSSNIAFDVGPALPDQSPSVKSVGITGQLTGSRADTIIADDVETPRNSMTVVQREKLRELVKEFDAVLKPNGRVIYLGTPQVEESLYSALEQRGYQIRIWPARYPKDSKQRLAYGDRLAPMIAEPFDADPRIAWKNVESVRFSDDDLLEREASYGRSGFMLQFMLDTSLSDAERYPLKLSDLIVTDIDPEVAPVRIVWSSDPKLIVQDIPSVGFSGDRLYRPMYQSPDMEPYTGKVMAIDPSGRGSDETGYAVTAMLRGMVYLRRAGATAGGYDEKTLETLAHIARAEKVNLILVESNFGDGMFTKLLSPILQRIYPCTVEEVKNYGVRKEERIIDTLEPVLNSHRLVVDASLLRHDQKTEKPHYQLFYQLTRITKDRGSLRRDDRIEAVEMAVRYWQDQLARDVSLEELKLAEEQADAVYAEFIRAVTGASPTTINYLDTY